MLFYLSLFITIVLVIALMYLSNQSTKETFTNVDGPARMEMREKEESDRYRAIQFAH